MLHPRALSLLLVGAVAVAQSFVSPAHFTSAEGTASITAPFGSTAVPVRYLQIHGDVPAMTVSGMAFRWECDPTGVTYPPFSVTLDAWISTAAVTAANPSSTFDANHGPDKVQVATHRTIAIPGSDPSLMPSPFVLDIPFDVPFPFAGSPASLCWEVQITARTNTLAAAFDGALNVVSVAINPPLFATRGFAGCLTTGHVTPITITTALAPMNWPGGTGTAADIAAEMLANGPIFWVLGFDRVSWNGSPLPQTVPGSAGAPSGACQLRLDIAWTTFAVATANGVTALRLAFGVQPALHGAEFYEQVIALDPAANAFGVTTSNLVVHQLVAPYPTPLPVCRVSALSLAATGAVDTSTFLVTQFH